MSVLAWILLGIIAGSVANLIDPRPSRGGILGSMVLGVLGALIGGYLGSLIFGVGISGFNLSSIIVASLGALLLLFIGRALRGV
ncbi:GlsB/YeaQ/YmgE family stress response membrane protein [Candidatus Daviesbacteria bacterium]|nr:GlsB/YeaQ/YmgE family stress response membrane protein [Candidatus Daviesbacteria bacterium]